MRLANKDRIGLGVVVATAVAVVVHSAPEHRATHRGPVADAGGAVTSSVAVTSVAFYDVNVIPMDRDGVLRHQVVVVTDGFVTRIGDVGVVEPPVGARIIDGEGTRFLAPGLTDAHVHLGDDPEPLLPLFIANGITTVLNLEGDPRHVELRERIRSGALIGPTIYTAGPFVDDETVRTAADAQRVASQHRSRGYDFVKLHGNLSASAFAALSDASHREGLAVLGHAPRNLPFSAVLENGQAAVSHAEELIYTEFMSLDTTRLSPIAEAMATSGTWLTPGVSSFQSIASQWAAPEGLRAALARPEADLLPRSMRRSWLSSREFVDRPAEGRPRIARMLAFHEPLVRRFHQAGVPILAGTDAGMPGMIPGFALHDELVALNRLGLTREEALAAATRNAGRFVRQNLDDDAAFGTITRNARADLVLLDADPREDLATLRRPLGVMARGRWFDRAALDAMLRGR